MIEVGMAPAMGPLTSAEGHVARTLVHELAHHIANDQGQAAAGCLVGYSC